MIEIAIPILVSILYRFPFGLLFVAVVAFIAMMPWLAMTLTLSCLIAAARPFKFTFRYAYALIALIPICIYLFLNPTRWSGSLPLMTPEERVKLFAPLVLAVLASCVLMAIVLMIAKIVNYRPGAIAPLLAVMFAVPAGLFFSQIGRDELRYRLLEHDCGPASQTFFVDRDENEAISHFAKLSYDQDPDPHRDLQAINELMRLRIALQMSSDRALAKDTAFTEDQAYVVRRCDQFRRTFPRSRHVPNVLYLQGRALDMRVDIEKFKGTGIVAHYQDVPADKSRDTWETLATTFPDSPTTCVALYRLAWLDVRDGHVDAALLRLRTLLEKFAGVSTATKPARPGGWRGLFATPPASDSLKLDLQRVVLDARKLEYLLVNNRDPVSGDAPLADLFQLDPHHPSYRDNLDRLIGTWPRSSLRDNLEVRRARALSVGQRFSVGQRIELLSALVDEDYPDTDAAVEGRFYLAIEHLRVGDRDKAREAFAQVIQAAPDSPWADDARQRQQALAS